MSLRHVPTRTPAPLVLQGGALFTHPWPQNSSLRGLEQDASSTPLWKPYAQGQILLQAKGLRSFHNRYGDL